MPYNKRITPFFVKHCFTILFLSLLVIPILAAENKKMEEITTWQFNSGPEQNQVLELFTSEGCSSCPPADRWLSMLKNSPDLWHRIIPIAFHVDYWNRLGWRDPFSSKENSERQKTYKRQRLVNGVYTPGFVVNGTEWRGWFDRQPLPKESNYKVGELTLNIAKANNSILVTAHFKNSEIYTSNSLSELSFNIALLAMNEQTQVKLGENRGKTLRHDFVATDLKRINHHEQSNEGEENNQTTWRGVLDLSKCQDCAVAAWANVNRSQQPIQATGGYLK